jgi:hypothetical protein
MGLEFHNPDRNFKLHANLQRNLYMMIVTVMQRFMLQICQVTVIHVYPDYECLSAILFRVSELMNMLHYCILCYM